MNNEEKIDRYRNEQLDYTLKSYDNILYYGGRNEIMVRYISDLHILHHLKYYENDLRKTINNMAHELAVSFIDVHEKNKNEISMLRYHPINVFIGDIASNKEVVVQFFRRFIFNINYIKYKEYKRDRIERSKICWCLHKKLCRIQDLKRSIADYIDYNKVIEPKSDIENYLESNYYKKRKLPSFVKYRILSIAKLTKECIELSGNRYICIDGFGYGERKYVDTNNNIVIDYKDIVKHSFKMYFVLGNHEMIDFNTVDEAVNFYSKELEKYNIMVLHNEYIDTSGYILYGGTGFAKYNNVYNANNLVNCRLMENNREYEIKETDKFERGYLKALKLAKESNKCLICISHYSTNDCISVKNLACEAIYFHGHNHENKNILRKDLVIYSDNQIGYDKYSKSSLEFKFVYSGTAVNPYYELRDGFYETNIEDYLKYVSYVREYISGHKTIDKKLTNSKLYVVKSKDYYGFFIEQLNCNGYNDIYILNGGKYNKIDERIHNINDVYRHFDKIVHKYIEAMLPIRCVQSKISHILKGLGFDGRIHGLIVDVDFFNHIMIDIESRNVRYYYSPIFGLMIEFENFIDLIDFMGSEKYCGFSSLPEKNKEIANKIKSKFILMSGGNNRIESNNNELIELNLRSIVNNFDYENSLVSLPYKASRYVCELGRLFDGKWLRKFELEEDIKYEIDNGKSTKINNRLHD